VRCAEPVATGIAPVLRIVTADCAVWYDVRQSADAHALWREAVTFLWTSRL